MGNLIRVINFELPILKRKQLGLFGKKAVNILLTLVILFSLFTGFGGVISAEGPEDEPDGTSFNLADFVSSVVITDLLGNVVDTYVVESTYKINIGFTEIPELQFRNKSEEDNYLEYTLPSNIRLLQDYVDVPVLENGVGRQVGSFSADKNTGKVCVTFDNFDDNAEPLELYFDHFSDTFFYIEMVAQFEKAIGHQIIDFGNEWNVDILLEDRQPKLSLEKSATPDNKKETVEYNVTIKAEKDDFTVIEFKDRPYVYGMSSVAEGNLADYIKGPITYTIYDSENSFKGSATLNSSQYTILTEEGDYKYITFNFPNNTVLSEGETIVVNYNINYGEWIDEALKENWSVGYGSLSSRYQYRQRIYNGVTVKVTDIRDETYYTNITTTYTDVERIVLNKTGKINTVDDTKVTFKLSAGADLCNPINFSTITVKDLLGNGLSFVNPLDPNEKAEIKITFIDGNGVVIGTDNTLVPGTNEFTYVVPEYDETDTDYPIIYEVRFEYDAYITEPGKANVETYDNTAKIIYEDGHTYETSTGVGNPNARQEVIKRGTFVFDDGDRDYILWSIKWTIPAFFYNKPVYLMDRFSEFINGTPYDVEVSYEEYEDDHKTFKAPAILNTNSYDIVHYGHPSWSSLYGYDNVNYNRDWFFFFEQYTLATSANSAVRVRPSSGSLSPFVNGAVVTIEYKMYLDNEEDDTSGNKSLRELLENGNGSATNTATAYWKTPWYDWRSTNSTATILWPILKSSSFKNGVTKYRIEVDRVSGSGGVSLIPWDSNPVFVDVFDSAVEYIDFTFYVWTKTKNGEIKYYGAYDKATKADLLSKYITKDGDKTTISVPLKELEEIEGPTGAPAVSGSFWKGPADLVKDPDISDWWMPDERADGDSIIIYYQMKVVDKTVDSETKGSVWNVASMYGFENGATTLYDRYAVKKDMVRATSNGRDMGNVVAVTVDINPLGLALASYPENKDINGIVDVIDTMNENLTPFLSSIQIAARLDDSDDYIVMNEGDAPGGDAWSYTVDIDNNIIVFRLPDETPIRITYNALVKGVPGTVPISNTINLFGKYEVEAGDEFQIVSAQSGAGGSMEKMTIYKIDEKDRTPLKGAEFALYADARFASRPQAPQVSDEDERLLTPDVIFIDGRSFYYVGEADNLYGPSDEDGIIVIEGNKFITRTSGAIYALVEVVAPEYCEKRTVFFSFDEKTFNEYKVQQITDYIVVTNTLEPYISCEVYKDTIKRTSAAYKSLPNQENFSNVGDLDEKYRYDIHFRSTSNIDADEFVLDDPLESVRLGYVFLEELWTPVVWGDKDELFNVWYKTNLMSSTTIDDPANNNTGKAYPNTGYKLWEKDLSTTERHYLAVKDLGLASNEYITGIRFEYGAVFKGFTSMNENRTSQNNEHRSESKGIVTLPANDDKLTRELSQIMFDALLDTGVYNLKASAKSAEVNNLLSKQSQFSDDIILLATKPASMYNSINGNNVDWTPDPARPDYVEEAANAIGLKPASYLVSATKPMKEADIVSSAIASIALGAMRDDDHDAVITKLIPTFEGMIEEIDPYSLEIDDPFIENAIRAGFDLRTSGGRERFRNLIRYGRAYTGDDTKLNVWLISLISSVVSILILISCFIKRGKNRIRRGIVRAISLVIALFLATIPLGIGNIAYAEDDELTDNITMEYRFLAGEESNLDVPNTINRFGREYVLVSLSAPVVESMLPQTRTYSFRISGALSPDDLGLVEEYGIELTPVINAFERNVDKTIVVTGLPNNEVEDVPQLPLNKSFEVTSASTDSGTEMKTLERAGIHFEVTKWEGGIEGKLPDEYQATVVYRGVETYNATVYYIGNILFSSSEVIGDIEEFIVIAIYAPADGGDLYDLEVYEEAPVPFVRNQDVLGPVLSPTEVTPQEIIQEIHDQHIPTFHIGDTEIPLWSGGNHYIWALMNLILAIAGVVQVFVTLIRAYMKKNRVEEYEEGIFVPEQQEKKKRQRVIMITVATIMGIIGVVLFFLTEDMRRPVMGLLNEWTIAYAAVYVIGVVTSALAFKRKSSKSNKYLIEADKPMITTTQGFATE